MICPDTHRLRSEKQPEDLSEDHFFDQERDCDGKDQAGDHCHESDDLLHMSSPFVRRESGNPHAGWYVIDEQWFRATVPAGNCAAANTVCLGGTGFRGLGPVGLRSGQVR